MDSVKGYFMSLFFVCILCVICNVLSEFSSKGVSSALELTCNIVLLVTVFSTLLGSCDKNSLEKSLSSITDTSFLNEAVCESEKTFIENTRYELERNVSLAISEKFGISPESVSIELITETNNNETVISVKSIRVTLPNSVNELTLDTVDIFADSLFETNAQVSINRSK